MGLDAKIRRFDWTDIDTLTSLFNEINGLTNTEKAFDSAFMRQFLSVPGCDPEQHCFLAESNGKAVGFTLIAYEPPISRAVASGGVLAEYRNQGVGRQLLKKAVQHAEELCVSVLHVEISAENQWAKGLLESEGFNQIKSYWQMQWSEQDSPNVNLPEGFIVRSFQLGEDEANLTELQNAAFGENWGFSPNTVEQIAARVRLDRVQPEGIIFIVNCRRTAAYNWTMMSVSSQRTTGFISMAGVHPDYRGTGLGTAIVTAGMSYLKSHGAHAIELEVDAENAPARELYLKLGFKKMRETLWYEKQF